MTSSDWMIYGANGYTGRLLVEKAIQLGLKPVLAGRNPEVAALASQHGLHSRLFDLTDVAETVRGLEGMRLVIHCAGPFSATSRPLLNACLRTRTHYLDITGEISVFESIFARASEIRAAGITAIPGVGFDVVPSDCLAAMLKQRLPDATHLTLAFDAGGKPSPGTAKTMVEGLALGGRIRRDGQLTQVPPMHSSRNIDFGTGPRFCVTIPWGDVSTAYHSTQIPNIEVLIPGSPIAKKLIGAFAPGLQAIAGKPRIQKWLKKVVEKRLPGSSHDERENGKSVLWGEVRNKTGRRMRLRLHAPNGYDLTAEAALKCAQEILKPQSTIPTGPLTPSMAFGADFVLQLAGVRLETLD